MSQIEESAASPRCDAPRAPLSLDVLAVLLDRHGVTEEGRRFIERIRLGDPVRSVQGAGGNVTGRYPSRKMDFAIQYESGGVEFPFLLTCETEPDVLEYYDQPVELSLQYEVEGKKGPRPVVVSHTPDFLVISATHPPALIECKSEEELAKLVSAPNTRYVAGADGPRCPPGEEAAAYYGCEYRVWTPKEVPAALTENARFLEAEWGRSARTFSDEVLARIVAHARDVPGISLEELVHKVGEPDPVYWALFHRYIYVDLADTFLTYTDRVKVFVDADAATLWRAALESVSQVGVGVAAPEVLAKARLAQVPPAALQVALERYKVLRPAIERDLPACKLPPTRRRWLLAFREAQRRGGVGLVGLCPRSHRQGNSGSRVHPRTEELMDEVAETEYETATNLTGRAAYALLIGRCGEAGAPCVSYNTWMRYLAKRDAGTMTRKRGGIKEEESQCPARRPTGPDVHGQAPLDTVHIDETVVDCLVRVGYGPGEFLIRPNVSFAYCSWSELVLGHDLFFDSPSIASMFMTLRDLYERHGRFPNRLVLDRAPWFGSTALDEFCAAAIIQKVQRPPGRPKFGTKVERMNRTINFQVVHLLAGNTQLLKDPRRLTPEVDPARHAVWRLDELDQALEKFLYEVYPNQPHKGLDMMTPLERYEQGRAFMGTGHIPEANPELRFLLWPPAKRATAKVDGRTGMVVEGIRYWHDDMRSDGVRGTRAPVRVDPHDAGHVVAFLKGGWVLCRSERYVELQGLSKRELRIASMALRARRRDAHGAPSEDGWEARDLEDFEPGTQL